MDKIEFYKNRSLGERFSASAEFIRQNWKVMYKLILIVAIPLALVMGYFQKNYIREMMDMFTILFSGGDLAALSGMGSSGGSTLYSLIAMLFALVISAMSGAIMSRYQAGQLSMETSLGDLSSKTFSNMGKLFLIGLVLGLIGIVAIIPIALIAGIFAVSLPVVAVVLFVLLFAAIIAVMPPLYLVRFPALFQEESTMGSIKKGFRLGFKSWGTTFVTILVVGIVSGIISGVLGLPLILYAYFGTSEIISYVLSCLMSLGTAIVTPLAFVFFAFQYFSVAEQSEGISLQSKIEEFDNL